MPQITDLPLLTASGTVDGSEEYALMKSGVNYKVTGTEFLATIQAALTAEIAATGAEILALQTDYLPLAGGTMTGKIVLDGDAVSLLHPVSKQQFDTALALKANATGATLDATATAVTAADTSETTALASTAFTASKIEYEVNKQTIVASGTKVLAETDKGVIMVNHTTSAPVTITLPAISGLTESARTNYWIVDTGLNAGTNAITINPNGSDTINAAATTIIDSDGESIVLFNDGVNKWFIKDKVSIASTTKQGLIELATQVEAEALTNATKAITPDTLGNVIDDLIAPSINVSASTSKTFAESDAGSKWFFTATTGSTVAISLPNAATFAEPGRFSLTIADAGNATANDIVITPTTSTIDGVTSFTIDSSFSSLTLYTDGTNYFTANNTARATVPVSPGGANTQFQYNNSGAFAGSTLLNTSGTTMAIGNVSQPAHLLRIDGDAHSASRMVHIEHDSTTADSYGIETNLSGISAFYKFGIRQQINGGVDQEGFCVALETGGFPTNIPNVDIGLHLELGHTTRDNYGAYIDTTSVNTGDNTGLYIDSTNTGAGVAYAIDINAGDIKLSTGTGSKIGTATSQKLGFWNATPTIQQSSTGETTGWVAGAVIADLSVDDTFTGNVGATAYTISDIVKHLKTIGIIAL